MTDLGGVENFVFVKVVEGVSDLKKDIKHKVNLWLLLDLINMKNIELL